MCQAESSKHVTGWHLTEETGAYNMVNDGLTSSSPSSAAQGGTQHKKRGFQMWMRYDARNPLDLTLATAWPIAGMTLKL